VRGVWLVLAAVLLAGCGGGDDGVDPDGAGFRFTAGTGKGEVIPEAERKVAPDWSAPSLVDGAPVESDRLGGGKVVVLNFWASWCGPCRVESPDFEEVFRATRSAGVEFVGVATKDDKGAAQAFVRRHEITFPNVFDPTGTVTQRFRGLTTRALPYTVVVDKRGRVAAVYPVPLLRADIEPVVRRLAAET
jgi:peroxiredoxin